MYFKDIIGHDEIKDNLIKTVTTESVGHAYIFDGRSGIGKKKLAEAFASGIMCENFESECCGKCKACHLSFNHTHPDIKILDLSIDDDGKEKASIGVKKIRELKSDVYLRPFYSDRKVYILQKAEKMTTEAQNAMLKIFEEPPSYVTFILICDGLSKILPTVLSRAIIYKFLPLPGKKVEEYLDATGQNVSNKELYSSISGGSIETVLKLISDEASLPVRNEAIEGMRELISDRRRTSFNRLCIAFVSNKDRCYSIINTLSDFLMDIIYFKINNNEKIINIDKRKLIEEISPHIEIDEIYNSLDILSAMRKKIDGNGIYKLVVIDSLISIWEEFHDRDSRNKI